MRPLKYAAAMASCHSSAVLWQAATGDVTAARPSGSSSLPRFTWERRHLGSLN
ncbi:hypothetical protein AX14_004842, partial [Amanita brunnescens Koide BX004]